MGKSAAKREKRSATIENPTVPVSAENFMAFFGIASADLPHVTTDSALSVPAVLAAVTFLSRTLAALPKHVKRETKDGEELVGGKIQSLVNDAPNQEEGAFKFWQYFWQQVFTGGRGLAWIERSGSTIWNLWPMDPNRTTISRIGGRLRYSCDGITYEASEVIDIPFMLRHDRTLHYGPIGRAAKAIQLAIAMNDYGSNFFAGGGVPPLSLEGPMPAGPDAVKRAQSDMRRSIDAAKSNGDPVFPIPPGYKLNPVGFDPAKGQMVEARLFQIQEIARAWQIPPNFLQDLSKATFANVEQGDLYLVKHLIGQWAQAAEDELSLKLFGRFSNRYVEHDLDGLMRGDFLSRMNGLSQAIQTAQLTPNEARAANGRSRHPNPRADDLLIQGATVPLGESSTSSSGNQSGTDSNANGGDGNVSQ